jgi:pSer/pThr/pTyr-binding forkhead associated (FHA) protein
MLIITRGQFAGRAILFDQPATCIIGRASDCDVQLPSDPEHMMISRHHCRLDINPPVVRICDLGSRNGTYVNGWLIGYRPQVAPTGTPTPPTAADCCTLHDGDELNLGGIVFRVHLLNESAVAAGQREDRSDPSACEAAGCG